MQYRLFFLSAIALLTACGKPTPIGDVPESFYYKGAPVDPSCFLDTSAQLGDNAISLNVCTGKNKAQPEYKEDHFYGVEIMDSQGSVSPPYVYYRYLGEVDGNHVIQTVSSGGGAGQYSGVRLVALEGNLLRTVKRYSGGDRCTNGVVSASVKGGSVKYTLNITPFDLAMLSNGNEAAFRRTSDLPGDSSTCVGTATYEDDKLESITLTMKPTEFPAENSVKGECFLGVYKGVFKPDHKMSSDDIAEFGANLNTTCGPLNQ